MRLCVPQMRQTIRVEGIFEEGYMFRNIIFICLIGLVVIFVLQNTQEQKP